MMLRGLVRRIGSPAIAICLDLGHAHIAADLRNTSVELLCEPVLDLVGVFHVHDNLGARRRASGREAGVDPLRLDLHLPPGRGTLPWGRIASRLGGHRAPVIPRSTRRFGRARPSSPTIVRSALSLAGSGARAQRGDRLRPGARRPRTRGTGR